jgi:2-C-methyl-D-erythritol 4-phosphate cytidylyltransferase
MSNPEDQTHVAVLIPAAGQGKRMGGRRKQFRQLGGKPLLVQTALVFERHPAVDYILVAAPAEAVRPLVEELSAWGVEKLAGVMPGGKTRQESVAAALRAAPDEVGVVLVHDAVRPFVRRAEITRVIARVREEGAAALAIPVADTLRRGADHVFGETVPREGLYRMQTPQGFRRDWFEAAHTFARRRRIQATDDVDLVQRLGHAVAIVSGSEQNLKITTTRDWAWAQSFWPHWEATNYGRV